MFFEDEKPALLSQIDAEFEKVCENALVHNWNSFGTTGETFLFKKGGFLETSSF